MRHERAASSRWVLSRQPDRHCFTPRGSTASRTLAPLAMCEKTRLFATLSSGTNIATVTPELPSSLLQPLPNALANRQSGRAVLIQKTESSP